MKKSMLLVLAKYLMASLKMRSDVESLVEKQVAVLLNH